MLAQSIRAVERKSSLVRTLATRAARSSGVTAPIKFNGKQLSVRMTALGMLGMACVSSFNVAQCQAAITRTLKSESGVGGGSGKKGDDPVSRLIDQYGGSFGQVSFGGAVGFCAGMAVKSIGKIAAVAIGVVFIGAQMAASAGYIQIDWKKVEKDAIAAVDPNGDGKITPDDFKIWWKKFLALSKHNLPSSGGFAAGFALGITYA